MKLLTTLSFAVLASAHGRVTNITTSNGTVYQGWNPESKLPLPELAAWSASNLGNIFVPPSRFNTSDIICHFNATPGSRRVDITAGDTLKLQWNEWPTSHVGPVLTYLATSNSTSSRIDRNTLKWVKIDELGWVNSTKRHNLNLGGTWAADILIANNFSWIVKIPEVLAEGDYVLRHEIIALHTANEVNGAQTYPQCLNLRISRGKAKLTKFLDGGAIGTSLYGMKDKGILVDVHKNITGYEIPGPEMWNGAMRTKQPNEKRWMEEGWE